MVLYPNKLPESERVCSGICKYNAYFVYLQQKTNITSHDESNTRSPYLRKRRPLLRVYRKGV